MVAGKQRMIARVDVSGINNKVKLYCGTLDIQTDYESLPLIIPFLEVDGCLGKFGYIIIPMDRRIWWFSDLNK